MIHGRRSARSAYSGLNRMVRISRPANLEIIIPHTPTAAPKARSLARSEPNSARLPAAYDLASRGNADSPSDPTAMFPTDTANPIAANIPSSHPPTAPFLNHLA